jgi:FdrA protein
MLQKSADRLQQKIPVKESMFTGIKVISNRYYDSVFLMGVNDRLSKVTGVTQCAVLMGSDANKSVLRDLRFDTAEISSATANDLVVAVNAENNEVINEILENLEKWLTEVNQSKANLDIHTLDQALKARPDANLVVISVPGEYAASETRKSLEAGKHVFLFSDNVSIEDEIALKTYARKQGLLVMGPDCGTSLIGGVGIGFANAVRRGSIGAIAAAGTGLQEFTTMVHNTGYGISHAIGTGGRDLSDRVGGLTTLSALDALEADPETKVITILSKPPGEHTLKILLERIHACTKPVVTCFLGIGVALPGEGTDFKRARVIDEAVRLAIEEIGGRVTDSETTVAVTGEKSVQGKFLRGVFAGGTFCYQSQQILREAGIKVYSNAPLEKSLQLSSPKKSQGNAIVDMGDEYFMVGRPHPMINGSQRAARILQEARDPEVGVLLLDFILGYNASMDPVGELVDSIRDAQRIAAARGETLTVVASICGTEDDIQDRKMQQKLLEDCGVQVFNSNAKATQYCVDLLER